MVSYPCVQVLLPNFFTNFFILEYVPQYRWCSVLDKALIFVLSGLQIYSCSEVKAEFAVCVEASLLTHYFTATPAIRVSYMYVMIIEETINYMNAWA